MTAARRFSSLWQSKTSNDEDDLEWRRTPVENSTSRLVAEAVKTENTEMIEYLLSRGFTTNIDKYTLRIAIEKKHIEHLPLL